MKSKYDKYIKLFDDIFNSPEESKVIKSVIKDDTYYAAVKDLKTNKISAVVGWFNTNNQIDAKYFTIMYEDMKPEKTNCPKEIIDLLTETKNKLALEWRNKCKEKFQVKVR